MLNYTCLYVGLWIITTFFYDPTQNSNYSYKFPEGCALSKIITGTRINSGTIIALMTVLVIWVIVNRTPFGFKANLVGENFNMANYAGTQLRPHNHPDPDSGWYAGGTRRRCGAFRHVPALPVFRTPGLWLGRCSDRHRRRRKVQYVPFAALFLSYLRIGADIMSRNSDIPFEIVNIIQAVMVLLISAPRSSADIRRNSSSKRQKNSKLQRKRRYRHEYLECDSFP